MRYRLSDLVHGIAYKASGGIKYDIALNQTGLNFSPQVLYSESVIDDMAYVGPYDILLHKVENEVLISVIDIKLTVKVQ